MYLFGIPLTISSVTITILSVCLVTVVNRLLRVSFRKNEEKSGKASCDQTFNLILERRTVMPKEFLNNDDKKVTKEELELILEAGNWAPTHQKNEPWRYVILASSKAIEKYLDFLEQWYDSRSQQLGETDMKKFKDKLSGIRKDWPFKVSHLILIGMRRQSNPDKKLPEWEEICAVAMSVQNMHLMASSLDHIGGFWSSHTWCKHARDSAELRNAYFGDLLPDPEDRIFGAFVLGRYPKNKQYRSSRTKISSKISWRE